MSRRLPQAHMVRMPAATIASDARIAAPDGAGRDRASPWHLLVLSCSRDRSAPDRAAELRRRLRPAPPHSAWLGGTLTLSPSIASARRVNPLHLVIHEPIRVRSIPPRCAAAHADRHALVPIGPNELVGERSRTEDAGRRRPAARVLVIACSTSAIRFPPLLASPRVFGRTRRLGRPRRRRTLSSRRPTAPTLKGGSGAADVPGSGSGRRPAGRRAARRARSPPPA